MKVAIIAVLLAMVSGVPALAATFVYVSNAEDGDIGMYTLQPDGSLQSGPRFKAEKLVMPMAVSPNKRFLIAAVRSKPYQGVQPQHRSRFRRAQARRHGAARRKLPLHLA
jgi:6-phosphogluconolactonase